jgi:hypothetical protein
LTRHHHTIDNRADALADALADAITNTSQGGLMNSYAGKFEHLLGLKSSDS